MKYTIVIWTLALAICLVATSGCGGKGSLRAQLGVSSDSNLPGLADEGTETTTGGDTRANNPNVDNGKQPIAPYEGLSSHFASQNFSPLGGLRAYGDAQGTNASAQAAAQGSLLISEGTNLPGGGLIYQSMGSRYVALNAAGAAISGDTVYVGASLDLESRQHALAGLLVANDSNVQFNSGRPVNGLSCDLLRKSNGSISLLVRYNRTPAGQNPLWYTSEYANVASGALPVQLECLRQGHTLVAYVNGRLITALSHPFPQTTYTGDRPAFDVSYGTKVAGFTNIGRNTVRSAALTVFPAGTAPAVFADKFATVSGSYLRTGANLSVIAANTLASMNGGYGQLTLPQVDIDNVDVSAAVKLTSDGGARIGARLDRTGVDSGYYASLSLSQGVATLQLQKTANGSVSNLGAIPVSGIVVGFQGRLRILAVGNQITAQVLSPAGVVIQSRSFTDGAPYAYGRIAVGTGGGAAVTDFVAKLP